MIVDFDEFFFDESGFDELVLYPILIVPHVIFFWMKPLLVEK